MTVKLSFKIDVFVSDPAVVTEIEARMRDFRPVFEDFVQKWARNNEEKFARSEGMEATGADVDPTVFWEPLKPSTSKRKRQLGQDDQIMVATGALREALTDADRFFHEEMPLEAAFGTPMAFEDEMKAVYNWAKRPTIFIGLADQKALEMEVTNYLGLGGNWKEKIFARGMENMGSQKQASAMDMEFNDAMTLPD